MFSAALYARVRFLFYPLHTRPPVQRASGIPCSLISLGDDDMQSSGAMRRENAEVYPLFEIDSEIYPRHCEERSCPPKPAFGRRRMRRSNPALPLRESWIVLLRSQ